MHVNRSVVLLFIMFVLRNTHPYNTLAQLRNTREADIQEKSYKPKRFCLRTAFITLLT
jgi:hypothetical protein